ncbi:hypothetical protein EYZ11_001566 [Aspergillus tanneri]|uniref:Uncharacterized protein n=1 Tax=Aspergillus tanneri TaxID=1220188 RepID=A0A4S3JSU8_9EURO|nr:hypothetical protein EYZ11_001566 [Aspergillus tanneri]
MAISTLILAPSAWYPPTAFNPIIEKLNPHGYVCHSIVFPSIQQTPAVEDLQPDRRRPNPGRSRGQCRNGSPLAGPSKTDREKEGKTGGVVRLVFVTAFIPDIGQSLIAAFGGTSPDWYIRDEKTSTVTANDPVNLFFHDVPDRHECGLSPYPCIVSPLRKGSRPSVVRAGVMVENVRSTGANIETEKIDTMHKP